ncbi:MAG: NAD(P)-dependent oxidoreductase [Formivibrio sp.]|nr:NAD(P)-dependent oxidoreductase [Formivibrio sp.]
MKILITGGTGFLGRHVVWRLAVLGHTVCFTGRNAAAARQVLALSNGDVSFVSLEHGVADAAAVLNRAAGQADALVHCAALSAPWGDKQAFYRANVVSTEEVLAVCTAQQTPRLVHVSTPSLYFEFRDRLAICEDAPLPPPVNEYARTKLVAEQRVADSPVDAIILRPRGIFGPWDQTLLPRLLRVMQNGRIPLFNQGRALLDLTYVDNVVDAICLALAMRQPEVRTFNISNGQPLAAGRLFEQLATAFALPYRPVRVPFRVGVSLAHLLEIAARLAPGWEPPLTRYTVGAIAFSQTLDLSQAQQHLGYTPGVSVAEGIMRTADWFANHQELASC